jgi:hypothetical protein
MEGMQRCVAVRFWLGAEIIAEDQPLIDEIRLLEEALHRPEVRHNREAVEELLAEGFAEIGASGRAYHRAEMIELLVSESDDANDTKLLATGYSLRSISADAVLLTYRTFRVERDGSERHVLRSSIWTRRDGRWQLVFHQGTIAPQKR